MGWSIAEKRLISYRRPGASCPDRPLSHLTWTGVSLTPHDRRGIAAHVHAESRHNLSFVSNFWALVRDARLIADRDLESGDPNNPPRAPKESIWPSSLLYMVLMDQIGTAFEPRGEHPEYPGQGFRNALDLFATKVMPLSTDEQAALYALRCSFAHDYSLVNVPSNSRRVELFHLFQLVWTSTSSQWHACLG